MVRSLSCCPTPTPELEFPCGSMSITSVRCSATASDAPRLIAVVVLPTPPFWFAMAIIRAMRCLGAPENGEIRDPHGRASECATEYRAHHGAGGRVKSDMFHVKHPPEAV